MSGEDKRQEAIYIRPMNREGGMLRFIDLFSGIGGFRRGLERSGHRCAGHVEIDPYAERSYMAMYGLHPCRYGRQEGNWGFIGRKEVCDGCDGSGCKGEWYAKDIKQIRSGEIPEAEIWTFGFPCTDISLSGRRTGLAGERSGLFFTVAGLLKGTPAEDRPGLLIIENVKHLLSSGEGGDFTAVLAELWEAGYDTEWMCVNSKDFGVPQNRERVYLVGYLGGRGGRKVFPVGGADAAALIPVVRGRQGYRVYDVSGLSITLTARAGGFAGRTGLYAVSVNRKEGITAYIETAHTLAASDWRGINRNQRQNGVLVSDGKCRMSMDTDRHLQGITRSKGRIQDILICEGNTVCTGGVRGMGSQDTVDTDTTCQSGIEMEAQQIKGMLVCCCPEWKKGLPMKPVKTSGHTMACPGNGINLSYPGSGYRHSRVGKGVPQTIATGAMGVYLCCRIRRLTPRECWRLQAFDDYLFDRAKAAGVSDAQLYKQAGNAVTVNIVYEIGRKLADMEERSVRPDE